MDPYTEKRINDVKQAIRGGGDLSARIYPVVANTCLLLTAYRQSGGAPGWSARLVDDDGVPMLKEDEREAIEGGFREGDPWLRPLLKMDQSGGNRSAVPQFAEGDPSIVSSSTKLKGTEVSFQRVLDNIVNKTNDINNYWALFAEKTTGVTGFLSKDTILPSPFGPIVMNNKLIERLLMSILDTIRLAGSAKGDKNVILTLLVLIEELITGQWRQMILTAVGLFSPTGVAIGVIGKIIVNAWMLVPSATRDDILYSMIDGIQGVFVGLLLWFATTLPPAIVKAPVEAALEKLNRVIANAHNEVLVLEESANKQLEPYGKKASFTKVHKSFADISGLTLASIGNLQNLATWPLLVCTKEFEAVLEAMDAEPVIYLLGELMGLPTTERRMLKICGTTEMKPAEEFTKEFMSPDILPLNELSEPSEAPAEEGDDVTQRSRPLQAASVARIGNFDLSGISKAAINPKEAVLGAAMGAVVPQQATAVLDAAKDALQKGQKLASAAQAFQANPLQKIVAAGTAPVATAPAATAPVATARAATHQYNDGDPIAGGGKKRSTRGKKQKQRKSRRQSPRSRQRGGGGK